MHICLELVSYRFDFYSSWIWIWWDLKQFFYFLTSLQRSLVCEFVEDNCFQSCLNPIPTWRCAWQAPMCKTSNPNYLLYLTPSSCSFSAIFVADGVGMASFPLSHLSMPRGRMMMMCFCRWKYVPRSFIFCVPDLKGKLLLMPGHNRLIWAQWWQTPTANDTSRLRSRKAARWTDILGYPCLRTQPWTVFCIADKS